MGQGLSCTGSGTEHEFFAAVQAGDLELAEGLLAVEPALLQLTTVYDRLSALHIATANGQIESTTADEGRREKVSEVLRRERFPAASLQPA